MRRVDLMSKTTTLVTMLSIVYALIDMKIIFLAPILTISIPYRFMKYKEEGKHTENRKILNNLFLFNLIVFIGVTAITNRMSTDIFEIIVNIIITFIYFKVLSMIDKKRETLYNNPQMVYDKINEKINALEMMYEQTEEGMRNAETEKARNSMEAKLNAIRYKIDELKRQSELIKAQIESKNNNKNIFLNIITSFRQYYTKRQNKSIYLHESIHYDTGGWILSGCSESQNESICRVQ